MRSNDNVYARMGRLFARLLCGLSALGLATASPITSELQVRRTWHFAEGDVWFSNEFSGARLNECVPLGPDDFSLLIAPENRPINQSPWYAFQVWSPRARTIRVHVTPTYEGRIRLGYLSDDGVNWRPLERKFYSSDPVTRVATMELKVGPQPLWVAAQEMIGVRELEAWTDAKARLRFAREGVIARSLEGRPIRQVTFGETTNANYVFIIARQHPPEVTGTLGMLAFVDTLTGSTRLAREYRRQFQTVVVPLVNPDGVAHGQWRSNLGAKDLNRDWREFTQPETKEVADYLKQVGQAPGARVFLFLDFHSTRTNIFYTQADDVPMRPAAFPGRWLDAIHTRQPGLWFERDNDHNSGQATAKAWAHETFGIPAITYEYGYGADRPAIRRSAQIAAEEMMRLLLAELKNPFSPSVAHRHTPTGTGKAE
ncbi:MAG: M14 family metallopeptidase [Limisphaerales bacterium]